MWIRHLGEEEYYDRMIIILSFLEVKCPLVLALIGLFCFCFVF